MYKNIFIISGCLLYLTLYANIHVLKSIHDVLTWHFNLFNCVRLRVLHIAEGSDFFRISVCISKASANVAFSMQEVLELV